MADTQQVRLLLLLIVLVLRYCYYYWEGINEAACSRYHGLLLIITLLLQLLYTIQTTSILTCQGQRQYNRKAKQPKIFPIKLEPILRISSVYVQLGHDEKISASICSQSVLMTVKSIHTATAADTRQQQQNSHITIYINTAVIFVLRVDLVRGFPLVSEVFFFRERYE